MAPAARSVITFHVPGVAVPQGSLRAHMAGGVPILHYTNREPLALWRDAVSAACRAQMQERSPLDGAIMLQLDIAVLRPRGHYRRDGSVLDRFADAWPASRPDIDKLSRAVLDALTQLLYFDDGQVVMLDAIKRYCELEEAPGMTVWAARPGRGVLL